MAPGDGGSGSSLRLGTRCILFKKLLCPESRADYGKSLGPVIATEDAHDFPLFVVNRATGEPVTSADLHRPVVDAFQAVSTIEGAVADNLVAVRPVDQHKFFIF